MQAIRSAGTVPGECLIVDNFNIPTVDRSNHTWPKLDGFDKKLLSTAEETFLYQSITQPTRFRMGTPVLGIVLTKLPDAA